jgi:tetratricopeptide (TPR) repeat protein
VASLGIISSTLLSGALISATLLIGCSTTTDSSTKPRQEALKQSDLGNYAQAEGILVPLVKTMKYRKAKTLANTTQQLAWVYLLDGRFKQAEELAMNAKYQHDQQEKKDTESQILDGFTLATVFTKEGKYEDAQPLFEQAIQLRQEALKANAPSPEPKIVEAPRLASLELGLGTLEFESGRYKEAEEQLQQSVKLAEVDAVDKKPNGTPILAEALEQIALVYQANGKYADAESVCKRGMRMLRDSIGMHRPQFIFAANNLMSIYSDQHRFFKVDSLVKAIWQRENSIFRADHPEILRSKLLNMASLSHIHREVPTAEIQSVYGRLIGNYSELYGPDNPHVIAPYQAAGEYELSIADYKSAEKNLRTALAISREKLSDKHPRTISILNSLALTLGFKSLATKSPADLSEAKKFVKEAISKQDSSLPEDNPIRARSWGILGSIYTISDDNQGAYQAFHRYLEASKKASYEDPIERIRFLKNFQSVLANLGYSAEAEACKNLPIVTATTSYSGQRSVDSVDLDLK